MDKADIKKTGAAICVFCGSSFGTNPAFRDAARAIGAGIAKMGYSLVFGGGGLGLMGDVAKAAHDGGAPSRASCRLSSRRWNRRVSSEEKLIVTPHMQERKNLMLQMSDAFLVLPGGLGTFDEFFEVVTEAQLGVHAKPIIVVNVSGYYDALDAMLHAIDRDRLRQGDGAEALLPGRWRRSRAGNTRGRAECSCPELGWGLVPIQLVNDGVSQRLERRIHDVGRHAHRGPAVALAVGAFHHHARHRLGAAGEDAHFVVHQPQIGEIGRNICPNPCAARRPAR